MHYYGYGYGLWYGILTFVWHVLILVAIVWVIMALFGGRRWRRWGGPMNWHAHSALSILNERYAKGEISKEEYEERKKTLMNV